MIVKSGRKTPLLKLGREFRHAATILIAAQMFYGCNTPSPYQNVAPAANNTHPTDRAPDKNAVIQPGDVLEVFVVEDDSLNGRYDVLDGGNIIFPKIGKIPVAGRTPTDVELTIKKLLETNQLRTATVMVERPAQARIGGIRGKTVFVSGNVTTPGRRTVPFVGDLKPTVYQAIVDAGGFTRFADQARVLVNRRGPDGRVVRVRVDAQKVRDGSAPDVPVEDGDMIFVPEKQFGW